MKTGFLLFTLLIISQLAIAQKTGSISGITVDSANGKRIPFATVALINKKQVIIKTVIADSTGLYRITDIPRGNYNLSWSAIGYKPSVSRELTISNNTHTDLGEQALAPEASVLAGIVIRGTRPAVTAAVDGFTYHPGNDLIPAGATASEIMNRIPMLSTDQSGAPVIRGSSNIRVYIDGKPSDVYASTVADALKQIPASDIEKIEVVLYPSAKYDAEGTDGVINIITKKSRFNALNGTLNARIGNRNQNISPSLNLRRGKWIFSSNGGIFYYQNRSNSELKREEANGNYSSKFEQTSQFKNDGGAAFIGLNTIFEINQLNLISAGIRYPKNSNYTERQTTNLFFQNNLPVSAFDRYYDLGSGNEVSTYNLGYDGKSKNRRHEYSMQAIYFTHSGFDNYDMDQLQDQELNNKEIFRGVVTNKELLLQADYVHRINDSMSWDAGLKSMSRQFSSTNTFSNYLFPSGPWAKDDERSNLFHYDRNIYAAYADLNMKLRGWQLRIGARYEQTDLQTTFKDTALTIPDFKNFIPSILVSKTFAEKNTLKWSYGRRISRPYFGQLNPAINYLDSFNLQAGNPYLDPELTHRYEMAYTMNGKKVFLTTSLFYNRTDNAIEQIRQPLNGGIFLTTYQNIGLSNIFGLSASITRKWPQKTSITATVNLRHVYLKSEALQQSNSGNQAGINLNFTYGFKQGFSAEIIGAYSTPDITLQGYREIWKYYALVLNKNFKGEKFALSIRGDTFLPPPEQAMKQVSSSSQFYQEITNRYQTMFFWISATWKFGRKEVKSPVVRQGGVEE